MSNDGILSGIRVLDFSRYKAGPYCAQLLGDMGAEVIRIERPGGAEDREMGPFTAEGESLYPLFTSRNKLGVTLNLRSPAAPGLVHRLVSLADVLVENFAPGGEEAHILDYAALSQVNPRLVQVSVTGFGHTGPYAKRAAFDTVAQAMSGAMSITSFPDGPPMKAGVNYVDFSTGIYAALGVMFALYARQKTGLGQHVDIALLDVGLSFMESTFAEYERFGVVRPQIGNRNYFAAPFDAFQAKDGYVYVAVVGQGLWRRFLKATGLASLGEDARFRDNRSRAVHGKDLSALIAPWMAQRTVAEIVAVMQQAQVPCGPVNTIPQAYADPQAQARQMVVPTDHGHLGVVPLIGNPIKMSAAPVTVRRTAPSVGEHNQQVYGQLLGLSAEDILRLQSEGAI